MTERGRARLRLGARVAFSVLGIAAGALFVRSVGLDRFLALLSGALPWLPLLLALEALRIVTEAAGTWVLCGEDARAIPLATWLRIHLVANAGLVVLPGGRAVSEGVKVARLAPVLGGGRAAAIVAVQHAATMIAIGLVVLPGVVIARGTPVVALALAIHAIVCIAGGLALQGAVRNAIVPKAMTRFVGRTEAVVEEVRRTARALPWVPARALGAKLVNRLAQVAQLVILLHAIGAATGVGRGFVATGVALVGSAVGELSPAQVGGTEGAFVLATGALGITASAAIALATLARVVQLAWAAVGFVIPMFEAKRAVSAPPGRSTGATSTIVGPPTPEAKRASLA